MRFSNDDVFDYVISFHRNKEDFSEGDLEERIYSFPYYELEEVLLSDLSDEFSFDEENVQEYAERDTPFPYIFVGNNRIIDGTHRVEAAKIKGLKSLLAYVGKNA